VFAGCADVEAGRRRASVPRVLGRGNLGGRLLRVEELCRGRTATSRCFRSYERPSDIRRALFGWERVPRLENVAGSGLFVDAMSHASRARSIVRDGVIRASMNSVFDQAMSDVAFAAADVGHC